MVRERLRHGVPGLPLLPLVLLPLLDIRPVSSQRDGIRPRERRDRDRALGDRGS